MFFSLLSSVLSLNMNLKDYGNEDAPPNEIYENMTIPFYQKEASGSSNAGLIGGIVAAVVAVIAILLIVTILYLRKSRMKTYSDNKDKLKDLDTAPNTKVDHDNPLYNNKMNDDPFEEEFKN